MTRNLIIAAFIALSSAAQGSAAQAQTLGWASDCEGDSCLYSRTMRSALGDILTLDILVNANAGRASVVATLPLGTAIEPGVEVSTWGTTAQRAFRVCLEDGCRVAYDLDSIGFAGLLQSGQIDFMFYKFSQEVPVSVAVPLDGLKEAIRATQ